MEYVESHVNIRPEIAEKLQKLCALFCKNVGIKATFGVAALRDAQDLFYKYQAV